MTAVLVQLIAAGADLTKKTISTRTEENKCIIWHDLENPRNMTVMSAAVKSNSRKTVAVLEEYAKDPTSIVFDLESTPYKKKHEFNI